jgi:hypothetical protein
MGGDGNAAAPDGIGKIRALPEVMLRVYSYLPVNDRVHSLALVDRAFARDPVRSGFLCATYGARFTLLEALDRLDAFADADAEFDPENGNGEGPRDVVATRREQLARMKAKASPATSLYGTFDPLVRRATKPHWLDDIVTMRASLKRFYSDGTFNRLARLVEEEGYGQAMWAYQFARLNCRVRSGAGRLPSQIGIPRLDPGCVLHLPDPDEGLTEHVAVSCSVCATVKWQAGCHAIRCRHGNSGHICRTCDGKLVGTEGGNDAAAAAVDRRGQGGGRDGIDRSAGADQPGMPSATAARVMAREAKLCPLCDFLTWRKLSHFRQQAPAVVTATHRRTTG